MDKLYGFSLVTKDYLSRYQEILKNMIQGMSSAELNNSIGHNFMTQMIPHHKAAIEMSQNLLRVTTCVPLQEIAQRIIREQTQSIANMEAILPGCTMVNTADAVTNYQNKARTILDTMFTEMGNACQSNNIDADFMWEMIPHHCGAIAMSQNALRFAVCPGLDEILDNIIVSQERGVRQMRSLLRKMGCCKS